jgi:hypothetical protein
MAVARELLVTSYLEHEVLPDLKFQESTRGVIKKSRAVPKPVLEKPIEKWVYWTVEEWFAVVFRDGIRGGVVLYVKAIESWIPWAWKYGYQCVTASDSLRRRSYQCDQQLGTSTQAQWPQKRACVKSCYNVASILRVGIWVPRKEVRVVINERRGKLRNEVSFLPRGGRSIEENIWVGVKSSPGTVL